MEFKNLRTFLYAAQCLNFTKTAEHLHYSQPAITAQLQTLEQEFHQTLFAHVGKQTFLTPAGEVLKDYSEKLFTIYDEMQRTLNNMEKPYGRLSIAAYETFCTSYFPPIISKYISQYKDIDIRLYSCATNEVIRGILANEYDIGIISGELNRPEIKNVKIAEEKLVLVVSNVFGEWPVKKIMDELPFLHYRIDGPFNDMMNRFISESKLVPKSVIEFDSLEAIKQAALKKLGVALISQNLVQKDIDSKTLRCLETNDQIKVITSLIMLRDKAEWSTAKTFCELLRSMWRVD